MTDVYEKLLDITGNETVQLASDFKELIGKELCLGQTRYMCRNGTLSDGHEKLTESQRYYQAIKEMHVLATNMRTMRAQAKLHQADIWEIEDRLKAAETAKNKAEILRQTGKLELAKEALLSCLITVEDQSRMIDEYNKVRMELQEKVRTQYPGGIEEAEHDNWSTVFKYRVIQRHAGFQERLTHVPLEKDTKAILGMKMGQLDATAWMQVTDDRRIAEIAEDQAHEKHQLSYMNREKKGLISS